MSNKAQEKSAVRIKTKLLQRGVSIAHLGREINRPRSTVSQAINQGRFPKVREQIERWLAS